MDRTFYRGLTKMKDRKFSFELNFEPGRNSVNILNIVLSQRDIHRTQTDFKLNFTELIYRQLLTLLCAVP